MAIRKQVVDGGRRTILRHTSGKEKGKLAGSLPSSTPPVTLVVPTIVPIPSSGEDDDVHAVSAAYERFLTSNAEKEIMESNDSFTNMQESPALELSQRTSALLSTGLDADQHKDVYMALSRSVKRWSPAPEEPSDEEWNVYLLTARARITDPTNGLSEDERAEALAIWEKAKTNGKPDAYTYALASSAETRMWRARYALHDHAVQIASWYDADPEDVKAAIDKYRAEYYAKLEAGKDVSIPEKYAASWRRTGGAAPKDPATAYSHYYAETKAKYKSKLPPTKYVALDLETTGLSTKDSHIIEVGIVEYDRFGNETGRWGQLICPPKDKNGKVSTGDAEVVAVHNITVKDVINQPTFDQILPELNKRLEGATLIGHNLAFDTKHLRVSMRNFADSPELSEPTWQGEADTMFHASRHMVGLENNKLKTVAESLDIAYTNGHRAEHDAAVSGEVFFRIRNTNNWGAR